MKELIENAFLISLGAFLVLGGMVYLFEPAVGSGPISKRLICQNRLRNIALALENYHEEYGSYPPAWVPDEQGKPLYSWRVLILPYLDNRPLYSAYNLDEPWDSPHNMQYSEADLSFFRCPMNELGAGTTNFVAVITTTGPWRGSEPVSKAELANSEDAVLLVEQHGERINWAEPRELDLKTLPLKINDPSGKGIGSPHKGEIANVSVVKEGRLEILTESMGAAELLRRLQAKIINER